jgi:hypothetical protein
MKMALFQEDANNAQKWDHKENVLFVWSTCAALWHAVRYFFFVVVCLVLTLYS